MVLNREALERLNRDSEVCSNIEKFTFFNTGFRVLDFYIYFQVIRLFRAVDISLLGRNFNDTKFNRFIDDLNKDFESVIVMIVSHARKYGLIPTDNLDTTVELIIDYVKSNY